MSEPAYELGAEHFCEVDVVPVLKSTGRWSAWPMPVSIGEDGLTALASAVNLDREDPAAVQAMGFPVLLAQAPETFCSGCLRWWPGPHNHEETEGVGDPTPNEGDTDA